MDRLQEIDLKHERVRALLDKVKTDGLWLRRISNIAWFTAGADASIPINAIYGMYSVLITRDRRAIYTNNIEATRLRAEEKFEALGFEIVEFPWYAPDIPIIPQLVADDDVIESELKQMRWVLTEPEQERYRILGHDAAIALDEAIRSARPGQTEYEIASRLDAACREVGGLAIVNLVAADDRISQFRHPAITHKRLDNYLMMVVCMMREGLVVAATRLVHWGRLTAELEEKQRKVAAIDAAVMVATQPGRTMGDAFNDLQAAYVAQGENEQWTMHHQGGLIAYQSRERLATPGDATLIHVGQAFAWNPSIVGCKSEDTILLSPLGFEIVTETPGWPMQEVDVGGKIVRRPRILEIG